MKHVLGFALFFVALGIGIMIFLPSTFAGVLVMIVCILMGYLLFCC